MTEGYYKVRIMHHKGTWYDCWQHVKDGQVLGYVMDDCVTPAPLDEGGTYEAIGSPTMVDFPNSEAGDTLREQRKELLKQQEEAAKKLAPQGNG